MRASLRRRGGIVDDWDYDFSGEGRGNEDGNLGTGELASFMSDVYEKLVVGKEGSRWT